MFDTHSAAEAGCAYVIIHNKYDKPTVCLSSNCFLPDCWRM